MFMLFSLSVKQVKSNPLKPMSPFRLSSGFYTQPHKIQHKLKHINFAEVNRNIILYTKYVFVKQIHYLNCLKHDYCHAEYN